MAFSPQRSPTLITLLALGTLAASAIACAPPPDSVTSSDGVTASPPGDPMAAPIFDAPVALQAIVSAWDAVMAEAGLEGD